MINDGNVRFPIVIISTPRSGSTALARHLQSKFNNIETFIEPEQTYKSLTEFIEYNNQNKKYIVKTHYIHLHLYPDELQEYLLNSDEPYRICIERQDTVKQVLSMYVEKQRQRWTYHRGDTFEKDIINIDDDKILETIYYYEQQSDWLRESTIKFDEKIMYEDCEFDNINLIKTPRPKNYDEVYNAIKNVYSMHKNA